MSVTNNSADWTDYQAIAADVAPAGESSPALGILIACTIGSCMWAGLITGGWYLARAIL